MTNDTTGFYSSLNKHDAHIDAWLGQFCDAHIDAWLWQLDRNHPRLLAASDIQLTRDFEVACQLENAQNELARVEAYRGTDPIAIDLQCKQIANAQAEVTRLSEALKPPKPPAPQAGQGAPVVEPVPMKPVQRGTVQDAAIIDAIRKAGHDPLALPKNEPGKPGVKAAVRLVLVGNHPAFPKEGKQFDKAWERLRSLSEIADLE